MLIHTASGHHSTSQPSSDLDSHHPSAYGCIPPTHFPLSQQLFHLSVHKWLCSPCFSLPAEEAGNGQEQQHEFLYPQQQMGLEQSSLSLTEGLSLLAPCSSCSQCTAERITAPKAHLLKTHPMRDGASWKRRGMTEGLRIKPTKDKKAKLSM